MKIRDDVIKTDYFNTYPADMGLVIDFADFEDLLSVDAGADYVQVMDYRLTSIFSGNSADTLQAKSQRAKDAEPLLVATFDSAPQEDLPDIVSSAMTIKNPGDMHIALPEFFDFSLSRVHTAAFDALKLLGPDVFKESNMLFIVQRTDVESGETHRPHVAQWHDHVSGGQNTDLVYLFHNNLGTENRVTAHNGEAVKPIELIMPDNSLSRVGGEIVHRPQENVGVDLRREWGGLTINIQPKHGGRGQNYLAENPVMIDRDHDLFEQFKSTASQILSADQTIHPLHEPETLVDHLGISVDFV